MEEEEVTLGTPEICHLSVSFTLSVFHISLGSSL